MLNLILMVLYSLQGLVPLLEVLSEMVEVRAVLEELYLSWNKGFRKLELECDNALLIEIILVGSFADSRMTEFRLIPSHAYSLLGGSCQTYSLGAEYSGRKMPYCQRGGSYCQRGNNRQLSYSRQRTTHPKPEPLPTWEKTFCIEVGAMPWERFVELKKNLYEHDKVFEWDDSASLTAFQEAKQRFWEIYHGFPCENKLPSNAADLYIEDVDWNFEIDPKLFSKIKSLTDDEDGEKHNVKEMDWFSIPLEKIQAT
ncbi:hypothetical protein Gotur_019649 [Gossypium turneri]